MQKYLNVIRMFWRLIYFGKRYDEAVVFQTGL